MKKIIPILSLAIGLGACADFISVVPESQVTTDLLYKTDADFKEAVNGMYAPLRSAYNDFWRYGDLRADDMGTRPAAGVNEAFNLFYLESSAGALNSTWVNYYRIVFLANTILTRIEEVAVPNKAQYVAETKFLRALAYFDLVRIFGDVPMITGLLTPQDAMKTGRTAFNRIYDEIIIPDLREAETVLPVSYSGSDIGRPTRGAAKSLLGMVYLTRNDFLNAESKLREVTTMGYALLPAYGDLFDFTKSEHHSEYIFDIEYISGGLGLGSPFTNLFMDNRGPLLNYYRITGTGGQTGTPNAEYFTIFEPADSRRAFFHWIRDGLPDGTPMVPIDTETYTTKYAVATTQANDSPANWKVLRYANVLLMFAEALNENGKTGEALAPLNQVRTRAGLEALSGQSQSQMREAIYLERRREFYAEGQRWFDLVRTGRALEVLGKHGMKPFMVVFPIPQVQLDIVNNPSIFPQNPGYE